MLNKFFMVVCLTLGFAAYVSGQDEKKPNAPATQEKKPESTVTTKVTTKPPSPSKAEKSPAPGKRTTGQIVSPGAGGVYAAFESLLEGIRRADVDAVMKVYWNSPQLILFNNNGTITRTWQQVRANRASSYQDMKDVRLDVRDVNVQMLNRDAAIVTCLWTQSQTHRAVSETATGRLTIVFRRLGKAWRAVHAHTSPDAPDPSRVLPSERSEPAPKLQVPPSN